MANDKYDVGFKKSIVALRQSGKTLAEISIGDRWTVVVSPSLLLY